MMFEAIKWLASLVLLSPVVLVVLLSLIALRSSKIREKLISRLTFVMVSSGLISALAMAVLMLFSGRFELVLDAGDWIVLHHESFHFHLAFVFDGLSIPFLILTLLLCSVVGAFTTRYLHREPGYQRFFILYALFTLGMVTSCVAGTVEVLFFGWELVGLSSALLVGFFHERSAPVINGLRVWSIYRLADAAFLLAAVALHHMTGNGEWDRMTGVGTWPAAQTILSSQQALGVGLLLLVAAAGKSALVPFSGWLPRAMEGPTASSAIFYGALSVHLGAYLLLRVSPLVTAAPALGYILIAVGLTTALYASLVERVQGDIKSALAFASLAQVGLIVCEIGMGWYVFALIHLCGHAMLRTVQLLRAPSLLRDYFKLETALGHRIAHSQTPRFLTRIPWLTSWFYRFALERGPFDTLLGDYLAAPLLNVFRTFSRWESAWIAWCGSRSGGSERSLVGYGASRPSTAERQFMVDQPRAGDGDLLCHPATSLDIQERSPHA
ncbi:MAG: oxidoreductase [Pirellulaceae bacterium]|nr:oxidoreductase [Pirellulaceae bacterium]